MITAYEPIELDEEFERGDMVEYEDDTYGVVVEKYEENFDFPGGDGPDSDEVEVEVDDEIVYVVGGEESLEVFVGSDLEMVDRDEVFDGDPPENPEEDADEIDEEAMAAMIVGASSGNSDVEELNQRTVNSVPGITRTQRGQNPWPKSWRDSDKPARMIALDAWQSMGASHTGCTRSMRGKVTRYNAFCAAFKDAIYFGYTGWREGGG